MYPSIYCPKGVPKPACCQHPGGVGVLGGKGPDGHIDGGTLYGGLMRPGKWVLTKAGWWLLDEDLTPQDLAKFDPSPRIVRWIAVSGANPGEWWRVPIMIAPMQGPNKDAQPIFASALDRVFDGERYCVPAEFTSIQERLFHIITGRLFGGESDDERDRSCIELATELLAIAQWVDAALLGVKGWLTHEVVSRILTAACGIDPEATVPEPGHVPN